MPVEGAEETVKIPVRWCALEGSPSASDSGKLNDILLERLDLVNTEVFSPQTSIQFRSGATNTGITSFPVIENKDLLGTTVGSPGDIVCDRDTKNCADFKEVTRRCREKWQENAPQVTGLVAVQVRLIIDEQGKESSGGLATTPTFGNTASQIASGKVVVKDIQLSVSFFSRIKAPAQELGHALSLSHNDGTGNLDIAEPDPENIPHNVMGYDGGTGHTHFLRIRHPLNIFKRNAVELTDRQKDRLREQSIRHIPDRGINPILPPLAIARVDSINDVPAGQEFIDIELFGVTVDQQTGEVTFVLSPLGELPDNIAGINYFFLADLDNDSATGGSPDDIGIATTTQGVELIAQIRVDVAGALIQTASSVLKYDSATGQFVVINDPSIQVQVLPEVIGLIPPEEGDPALLGGEVQIGEIITIRIPGAVVGLVPTLFNLEAIAENPNTGVLDVAQAQITFELPVFSNCLVTPTAAILGSTVVVEATGLPPLQTANIFLGAQQVATTPIDGAGNASIDFQIPEDAATGQQPIRVGEIGTAITADCSVFLQAVPEFDVPPTPPIGSTLTVVIGDTLNFDVQASDRDVGDVISLNAIGAPLALNATFPSTQGNPATGTFSWTPEAGDVGTHPVTFTATDDGGLSAPPHTFFIEVIENRPPTADAGGGQAVECGNSDGAVVSLDGTGSSDPDGDDLTFSWSAAGITFDNPTSPTPTATFPLGSTTVTLVVNDGTVDSAADLLDVNVMDTTPPTISTVASPSSLRPANHKYVPIDLSVVASDVCDSSPTVIAVVQSSEPDNGKGDGNTTGDIKVTTASGQILLSSTAAPQVEFDPINDHLELRAERSGKSKGRTYTIMVTATDASGNQTTATTTVIVPHDKGKKGKKK